MGSDVTRVINEVRGRTKESVCGIESSFRPLPNFDFE